MYLPTNPGHQFTSLPEECLLPDEEAREHLAELRSKVKGGRPGRVGGGSASEGRRRKAKWLGFGWFWFTMVFFLVLKKKGLEKNIFLIF